TDLTHIRPFVHAALGSSLFFLILRVSLPSHYADWRVSVSINMMDTVLGFGGVYAMRLLRRAAYDYRQKQRQLKKSNGNGHHKRAVLLLGAGRAGLLAAKEIEARGDSDLVIKGFIDDDRAKLGRTVVLGHKVVGTTQDLQNVVRALKIDHVVITIANAPRHQIHRIVRLCEEIPVRVRIIPQLHEIIAGSLDISRIRAVQIEDLLGREPVELDMQAIQNELTGKTVMVTGAGGSIGSELARQVKRFAPAKLLLVERAEFALFDIDHELRTNDSTVTLVPLVADVGDESRMRSIFSHYRPQVVIHASAHKHVPLMDSHGTEAVKNNVLNTRFLAELAGEFETQVFVLVSTDKAVRPTSVMGATKRAAELMVQDLNRVHQTRYV